MHRALPCHTLLFLSHASLRVHILGFILSMARFHRFLQVPPNDVHLIDGKMTQCWVDLGYIHQAPQISLPTTSIFCTSVGGLPISSTVSTLKTPRLCSTAGKETTRTLVHATAYFKVTSGILSIRVCVLIPNMYFHCYLRICHH